MLIEMANGLWVVRLTKARLPESVHMQLTVRVSTQKLNRNTTPLEMVSFLKNDRGDLGYELLPN